MKGDAPVGTTDADMAPAFAPAFALAFARPKRRLALFPPAFFLACAPWWIDEASIIDRYTLLAVVPLPNEPMRDPCKSTDRCCCCACHCATSSWPDPGLG
jgi:hypothetical protein